MNNQNKEYWNALPKKEQRRRNRAYGLRKNGWTVEAYETQLSKQKGLCANKACGQVAIEADHDHKLKIARFVLCHNCNVALGYARDDIDVLKGLVGLLRRWEQRW